MKYSELIANSNIAFGSGDYNGALKFAESAINADADSVDGYSCAGKACMSLEMTKEAVQYFKATPHNPYKKPNAFNRMGKSA